MTAPLAETLDLYPERYNELYRTVQGRKSTCYAPNKRYVLVYTPSWSTEASLSAYDTLDEVTACVVEFNLFSKIRFVRDLATGKDVPFEVKLELKP